MAHKNDLTEQEIQQVNLAIKASKAGQYREALNIIENIHHPKVDRLRNKVVKAYRAKIANEVSPPKTSKEPFTPSEPILLLDEADNPQPPSSASKSRWKFLKKWLP